MPIIFYLWKKIIKLNREHGTKCILLNKRVQNICKYAHSDANIFNTTACGNNCLTIYELNFPFEARKRTSIGKILFSWLKSNFLNSNKNVRGQKQWSAGKYGNAPYSCWKRWELTDMLDSRVLKKNGSLNNIQLKATE